MGKASILIVEDEAIVAADLAGKLGQLGYTVCGTTARGEEALALMRDYRPDLVLMDIRLAGVMDGVAAAEHIRREFDVPVIYLTAHSDSTTLQRATLTESFGYMLKPFEERDLQTHIEMALYKHGAEQKLRESERQLRQLIELCPVAMAVTDAEKNITVLNRRFVSVFGYTLEDIPTVSDWWASAFPDPGYRQRVMEKWARALKDAADAGTDMAYPEYRVTCKDGSVRDVQFRTAPVSTLRLVILNDLTERKQAEKQVRQAHKMEAVGRLAGGVAHDFNNLLQIIMGNIEIVKEELSQGAPMREALDEVAGAAQHAADLTRQLLAFGRRQIIRPDNVDLNGLVSGALKSIRHLVGDQIDVQFTPGNSLDTALADKGQVEQMLMNLCMNAREAMMGRGTLLIQTDSASFDAAHCQRHPEAVQGRYVRLSVRDTGHGMDTSALGHVFEPFFTTKGVGEGAGLGLAQVYGIVTQHKGFVDVQSAPGAGAVFNVYLPAVEHRCEQGETPAITHAAGRMETILVAEDEPAVLKVIATMLRSGGYTVLTAASGGEALQVFAEHADSIGLAVLDVMMPGLGGRQVMDLIRAKRAGVRFLFSTGYSENAIDSNFVVQEGLRLIQKPYRREVLLREVRRILDESAGENKMILPEREK